jgi:hypothetical protein
MQIAVVASGSFNTKDYLLFAVLAWPTLAVILLIGLTQKSARPLQFSFRKLLVAMTLLAILFGLLGGLLRN